MPEGHTLHRLAGEHTRLLAGQMVRAGSPQGRFAEGAARISGRRLHGAQAHGKHLFHRYEGRLWLHVHLGLYGAFDSGAPPAPQPRGAVRLRLVADAAWVDLRGPAACEVLDDPEVAALRSRLGPDPLRADADPDLAWRRVSRSRTPVAALLMDQSVLAGVGNAYRAEVLFRHGIDPYLPGRELSGEQWAAVWADLLVLMREGVRTGRIDTVRPEHSPEAQHRPPREDRHGGEVYVYRRHGQRCLVCGTTVAVADLLARRLYWCPTCQPSRR